MALRTPGREELERHENAVRCQAQPLTSFDQALRVAVIRAKTGGRGCLELPAFNDSGVLQ